MRPMFLTQRGRGVAIPDGVRTCESRQERLELSEDVRAAQ